MHYHDWLIHSAGGDFDCNSSGIPHRHAMSKLIAQKGKWKGLGGFLAFT